jgi:hypothetical protein
MDDILHKPGKGNHSKDGVVMPYTCIYHVGVMVMLLLVSPKP